MAEINGTDYHDYLTGTDADDTLSGGRGNDHLEGGQGDDTYAFGRGDGQDTILQFNTGYLDQDRLQLGAGIGLADLEFRRDDASNALIVKIAGTSDSVRIEGYFNPMPQDRLRIVFADGMSLDGLAIENKLVQYGIYIEGTAGSDTLVGGNGQDYLLGNGGNDILHGDGGMDYLDGGSGNDVYVFGRGDGQDAIVNGFGGDTDQDRLQLGSGISLADVEFSRDYYDALLLTLPGTNDSLRIDGYFDKMPHERMSIAFADGATLDGFAIENIINNSYGSYVEGSFHDDTLVGGKGDDYLLGNDGSDILYGDAGNDQMDGGIGNDTYVFGRGDGQDKILQFYSSQTDQDKLQLGSGIGLADMEFDRAYLDNALTLKIAGSTDSVRIEGYFDRMPHERMPIVFADGAILDGFAIERKLSYDDDYDLTGSSGNDTLDGGLGDDRLYGGDGDDILYGDAGHDILEGGWGNDRYVFGYGDGQDLIWADPSDPGNQDTLQLASGIGLTDVEIIQEGSDLIVKLAGTQDSIRIASYFNFSFDQRPSINFADGAVLDSLAVDTKLNNNFGTYQFGTSGNNTLVGGNGDDTLYGNDGNDILHGDGGMDFMSGDGGNDTYVFGRGDGHDTILQGNVTYIDQDTLQLGHGIGLADVEFSIDGNNNALLVSLSGSEDSVRIENYFDRAPHERMKIVFDDGAVLDGIAIDRKMHGYGSEIIGTSGNDTLVGSEGDDYLYGHNGNDVLYGDAGNDQMDGGLGNDTYYFGRGDGQDSILQNYSGHMDQDKLNLGSGISLADVTFIRDYDSNALIVALAGTSDNIRIDGYFDGAPYERIKIVFADGATVDGYSMENILNGYGGYVEGSPGNDTLIGGTGGDSLYGQDGNDILYGDDGDDWLEGSSGNDTYVFGRGDGRDTIVQFSNAVPEQDTLLLGANIGLDDLQFIRDADENALIVHIVGSADSVRILGYFDPPLHARMNIQFSDGSSLDGFEIENRIAYSNQYLQGTPDADVLIGGAGNDIIEGFAGDDVLRGGDGDDLLVGGSGFNQLFGDAGDDEIDGGRHDEIIFGGTGNDFLYAGSGSDLYQFLKGDGIDTIYELAPSTNADTDVVYFVDVASSEIGSVSRSENDLVIRYGTDDQLTVADYFLEDGSTNYKIEEFRFADGVTWHEQEVLARMETVMVGTDGDDQISGNPSGKNSLYGLDGNDTLIGGNAGDRLDGGNGDDSLFGDSGNDTLVGGAGNDYLYDSEGDDTYVFNLGDGQDFIVDVNDSPYGSSPINLDTIRFGEGIVPGDIRFSWVQNGELVVSIAGTSDQIVVANWIHEDGRYRIERMEFADGTAWDHATIEEKVSTVEIVGTEGDDLLSAPGSSSRASLYGLGGSDTLHGNDGDNVLSGGTGADWLIGYAGSDTYLFNSGDGQDTVMDYAYSIDDSDTLRFGEGITADRVSIDRSGSNIVLRILESSDSVTLNAWSLQDYRIDRVVFADGTVWDNAYIQSRIESIRMTGTDGDDTMHSWDGLNDYLYSMGGNDTLHGNDRNNTLDGGEGHDTLIGNQGSDTLMGSSGNDTYVFNLGDGMDTIHDRSAPGQRNVISFGDGISANDLRAKYLNGALIIHYSESDAVVLNDFDLYGENANAVVSTLAFANGTTLDLAAFLNNAPESAPLALAVNPDEDMQFSYQLPANLFSDADTVLGDRLTLTARSVGGNALPAWLSFDPATATFSGTPGNDAVGPAHYIEIIATDRIGATSSQTLVILVNNVNDAPTSSPLADQFLYEDQLAVFPIPFGAFWDEDMGEAFSLDFSATLANGDPLPDWISFDKSDQSFFCRPGNAHVGSIAIKVTATDPAQASASSTFVLHVANVNDPPERIQEIADQAAQDGLAFSFTVPSGTFADIDPGDRLALSATLANGDALPDWLKFDPETGTFSGKPTDADLGTIAVAVKATDTADAFASDVFTLTVNPATGLNLLGTAAADKLVGASGNDTINGLAGIDSMTGKKGNDLYIVDHASDKVIEQFNEGIDTVESTVSFTLADHVENLALKGSNGTTGKGNGLANAITGNGASNTLYGYDGDDTINGGAGGDKMLGGKGDDTYIVDNGNDAITELAGEGTDTVYASVSESLAAQIEALFLTGTASNGTGNGSANLIVGNSVANILKGQGGNDILQGAGGNDTLSDTSGNAVLDGGAGSDSLTGGTGRELFIGGQGNDTITTSSGADIIAFNKGDGQDIVNASTGKDNTISLAQVNYADLLFRKSGSDLILSLGSGDQISLKGWYSSGSNRNVATLQVVIEGSDDYQPGSSDIMRDQKIEQFDFIGLAAKFDAARVANPNLSSWSLSNSLLEFHLDGSDTSAIGGDLTYQYAMQGNLNGLSLNPAQAILGNTGFGLVNQELQSPNALQDGSPRLI